MYEKQLNYNYSYYNYPDKASRLSRDLQGIIRFPHFQLPRARHTQTRHISICFFNSKRKSTINIFAHQSQTKKASTQSRPKAERGEKPPLPLPILSLLPHLLCFRTTAALHQSKTPQIQFSFEQCQLPLPSPQVHTQT